MAKSGDTRRLLRDAKSGGSKTAVAAFLRSGAGSHGKHGAALRRAERRNAKTALRRGDWA